MVEKRNIFEQELDKDVKVGSKIRGWSIQLFSTRITVKLVVWLYTVKTV